MQELEKYKDYFDHIFDCVDSNIKLDENQRKAILCCDRHLLVVAGAGSGKTTTMSAKVKFLIEKKNINQKDILVISFTNKATYEIANRIQNDFSFNNVEVCTFHKLGIKILKQYYNKPFFIISDEEKYNIISDYIKTTVFENKELLKNFINYFIGFKFDLDSFSFSKIEDYHTYYCKKNKLNEDLTPIDIYYENFIKKYAFSFINLYKSMQSIDTTNLNSNLNNKLFIMRQLYEFYQQQLKKMNKIDFEDMILSATNILPCVINKFSYKYIIIDEYQDISYQRYKLIKLFSELTDVKIMAVGDDFQAIFSFAGSKINLFTDFTTNFNNALMIPIVNTYRNSQELIDVASEFILKNKYQIHKELISYKHLDYPIEVYEYEEKSKAIMIANIICTIFEKYNGSILLLGRYREDLNSLLKSKIFFQNNDQIICLLCKQAKISFLTVHSSKGLGYDNCILINALDNTYGFPSKVEDDELFKLIKNEKNEDILYPEERRLFYVALTRTKNKFYIVIPKENKSIFVDEILKNKNVLFHPYKNYKIIKVTDKKCKKCNHNLYVKKYNNFYYFECLYCDSKFSDKIDLIKKCPKCEDLLFYFSTDSNGYDIYRCLNPSCNYQIKQNKIIVKIKKIIKFIILR